MKTDMNVNLATLPAAIVDRAIAATGARSARGLVLAALKKVGEASDLAAQTNIPNAATVRALRSKAKGRSFDTATDAVGYLKKVYAKA